MSSTKGKTIWVTRDLYDEGIQPDEVYLFGIKPEKSAYESWDGTTKDGGIEWDVPDSVVTLDAWTNRQQMDLDVFKAMFGIDIQPGECIELHVSESSDGGKG